MSEDMLKIVGIIVIVGFLIYLAARAMKLHMNVLEGMTSNVGGAGNTGSLAESIKADTIKLQDSLLISKYRHEYESLITNMDDYFNILIVKALSDLKFDDAVKYNNYKDAIENAMVTIDAAK